MESFGKILLKIAGIIAGFLAKFTLFFLVFIFSVSLISKKVIQKEIIGNVLKGQVVTDYIKGQKIENEDKINELINDKKINSIINDVIAEYDIYLKEDNYKVSDELINEIIDFCIEHKAEISEISGREITEEEIRSAETYKDLTNVFEEGFSNFKNDFSTIGQELVKIYNKFISSAFRLKVFILMMLMIGIIMLSTWSLYSWLSSFGKILITNGVLFTLIYFITGIVVTRIVSEFELDIKITFIYILIVGLSELFIGIALVFSRKYIEKREVIDNNLCQTTNLN